MKFLLFADLHYAPGLFWSRGWDALKTFQRRAEQEGCDFIIHAGDLGHSSLKIPDFIKAYNDFHIPSYHCLGNHDGDGCTIEDVIRDYKMPHEYYYFDACGYRMIITNTNYYKHGDEYVRYSGGNYYSHPAERDYIPPEQLDWIRQTVEESSYPCILFSHQSFERCDGLKNRDDVLAIIDEANKKRPHSVLMCINGHCHRDFIRIRNNVIFFDVNSASYDWIDNPHNLFPKEEADKYEFMRNTVCYTDPLYAVVTVEGTTVTIDGMESTMYHGITREMTDNPVFDRAGRPVTPRIESAKITIG